jgi:lysine-specific histone demethylase 1B
MDWGNQKYIEGLYSFPSPGIKDNYRKIIGEPIKNKIFFCGEAYHEIFRATINGAMETGIQTAQRIS